MLTEFLNRLLDLRRPETVTLSDGRVYATDGLSAMINPEPPVLNVATLTALVDYFKSGDNHADKGMVQVVSPTQVHLLSTVQPPFAQRTTFLKATAKPTKFAFGSYMELERLNIGLLSEFKPNAVRDTLLSVLSKIKTENGVTFEDDGVTQKVTVKNGVACIGQSTLPKTVKLRPYRTFLEIEQPEGEYLLRLKQTGDGKDVCITGALIEADGGKWEIDAIQSIQAWLADRLPEGTVILA